MKFLNKKVLSRIGSNQWACSFRAHASLSARELEASRLSCERDLRTSSLLLLVHESLIRSGGRKAPLIDCEADEMIAVPSKLDAMDCCLMISEPDDPSRQGSQKVTYMNQAAREHLFSDLQSVARFSHLWASPVASPLVKQENLASLSEPIPLDRIITLPPWTPARD